MISFSVFNYKGGIGKSTISLNYCGFLVSQGKKVALIDVDPQRGSTICAEIAAEAGNPLPFQVVKKLSDVKGEVDAVVFDHAPGVNPGGPALSQIVIVPTILDAANHAVTLSTIKALKESNKLFIVIPNRVEIGQKEQKEMLEKLFPLSPEDNELLMQKDYFKKSSSVVPYIKKRVSYSKAYGQGMTIFTDKSGLDNVVSARNEFKDVANYITLRIEQYLAQLKKSKTANA